MLVVESLRVGIAHCFIMVTGSSICEKVHLTCHQPSQRILSAAILTSVDWQERRQESTRHPDNTNPNLPRQVKDKFDLLSPQSQPKRQTAQAVLLPNWLKTRKTSDECTLFTRHDRVINRQRQLLNDVLKTSQLQHSNEPKTDASMAARAKITGDDKKQGTMKTTECTRTHRWHAFVTSHSCNLSLLSAAWVHTRPQMIVSQSTFQWQWSLMVKSWEHTVQTEYLQLDF